MTAKTSKSHAPFAVMNRVVNPLMKAILRAPAPFHRLASGSHALLTYTGRRSGRSYTIPVLYRDKGERITVAVGWPDRKVWWRNLTGEGGTVTLLVRGRVLRGHAVATRQGDADAVVRVELDSRAPT